MSEQAAGPRRGVARTLTLDVDADELLRALNPYPRGHGRLVSELIRREDERRRERKRIREELCEAVEMVLAK